MNDDFGLFAYLIFYTGCRRGEAEGLRYEDIDRERKRIHIRRSVYNVSTTPMIKEPKTEAGIRSVPLLDALADALDALERRAKIPQLLLREGKPWDFTCIPVTQYGEAVGRETEETFSCLLDRFYGTRDQQERIAQKTQALRKNLTNLRNRTARSVMTRSSSRMAGAPYCSSFLA